MPELHFHAGVMAAVARGNIDRLLSLDANAAQPLKAADKRATTTLLKVSETEEQALAVFMLNGVPMERPKLASEGTLKLMRFAAVGADTALMKSGQPFMRETACLHGLSKQPRHPDMLETVFDESALLRVLA